MSGEGDKVHKLADFVSDYGWEVFSVLPTILLAFWGAYYNKLDSWWLQWGIFMVISLLTVFCTIKLCQKKESITGLRKEMVNKGLKIQELEMSVEKFGQENTALFNNFLYLFAKTIGIKNEDRITVYKKSQDSFITIGRYSPNPKFQKFHRMRISITEGFIAKALAEEELLIENLPEYTKPKHRKVYNNAIRGKCDIEETTLDAMTMKSRFYYCKALTDPTGMERKAIVVIESTKPQRFTQQQISDLIKSEELRIQAFVEKCRFIPIVSTELANEKGF